MMRRRGRPRLERKICRRRKMQSSYFKPAGIKTVDLDIIKLTKEELEALRLKNIKKLDQRQSAEKMNTSPATFQRILSSAYEKVSLALNNGMAIQIEE